MMKICKDYYTINEFKESESGCKSCGVKWINFWLKGQMYCQDVNEKYD